MRIRIDKKRILLSITTILSFLKIGPKQFTNKDLIVQIINIIGSIGIREKKAIIMLKEKIEIEIGHLFDYLDSEQCKTIVEECFSSDYIEQYILKEDEAEELANKLKDSIYIHVVKNNEEKYNSDYILHIENYKEKADLLLNKINEIISTNEVLRIFEHQIVGMQTLSMVNCNNKQIQIILDQIAKPNSAYIWHTPRQKNVNREIFQLHYTAGNVQLYDREIEMNLLLDFCGYTNMEKKENILKFQWWMITGEGGTGKSRLVYEFSKIMEMKGWTICYPFNNRITSLYKCSEFLPNNTLFVIDYTDMDLADIGEWLTSFGANNYSEVIIRVILIQRFADNIDSLNFSRDISEKNFIKKHAYNDGKFLNLKTISDESLKQLIIEYGKPVILDKECDSLFSVLSKMDKLKRPLFALAIADAYKDGLRISDKIELLKYICDKEDNSIRGKVNRVFSDKVDELSDIVQDIYIIATMVGGINIEQQLEILLPDDYFYLNGLRLSRKFFKDTGLFNFNISGVSCDPIEPDIIGEYYVLKNIQNKEEMLRKAWEVPYYMSRFVTRLYQDFKDYLSEIETYVNNPILSNNASTIEQFTFSGCSGIINIEIPACVSNIGRSAFQGCSNLKKVTIPDTVTELSTSIFEKCIRLENVKLSNQISILPQHIFSTCCYLNNIEIPNTVTQIDDSAFFNCINLEYVNIDKNSLITMIGYGSFSNCIRLKSITLPFNLIRICENAFDGCINLESIEMFDAVEYIEDCAFIECFNLKYVKFSANLKSIGELAFAQCKNLENVDFPESTVTIGNGAFFGCENPKLLKTLKDYCSKTDIDFNSLFIRTGIYEYLAETNEELYLRKLQGMISIETFNPEDSRKENESFYIRELEFVCKSLGFETEIWKDKFLIKE